MADMSGKRVLITGAAKGIGLCLAREFAKAGSKLVLTDIDQEALKAAVEELKGLAPEVHGRVTNVADRKAVEELARWVTQDLGGLDVLVNNAGIGLSAELAETTLEQWKRLLDINLWGPLYHVYAFLPSMIERRDGQIVNISSGQAFIKMPTWGAYAAVKTALAVFSEILHWELRKHDIHVTTVYPFMVNTGFYKDVTAKAQTFGARMSMKLLPYYSYTPEKTARVIFNAVRRRKKTEMASVLNELSFYGQVVPFFADLMSWGSNLFLAKHD